MGRNALPENIGRRSSDPTRSSTYDRPESRATDPRPVVAIVDDEPDVVDTLALLLPAERYRVLTYTRSAEFLSALEDEKPDVLVLDLVMPPPDGWEVLRRLHALGTRIPVIVATGSGPGAMEKSLQCGAVAAVMKPYAHEELTDLIDRVLSGELPK